MASDESFTAVVRVQFNEEWIVRFQARSISLESTVSNFALSSQLQIDFFFVNDLTMQNGWG
jgi:hypothetical protein